MSLLLAKPAQKLGYTYRPYQADMISGIMDSPSPYAYNASEMGLGKTIIAYGTAYNYACESVLVICPASLRINWLREGAIWGGPNLKDSLAILAGKDLAHIESKGRWQCGMDPALLVISYDMLVTNRQLRRYVAKRKWDMIIADEFHFCRSMDAQRTLMVMALLERTKYFQLLSGTPLVNSGADLFPAVNSIVPELDYMPEEDHNVCVDFDDFGSTFAYKYRDPYGIVHKKVRNPEWLKEILKERGMFYFRVLKKDVLPDLPDKTYHPVELSLDIPSGLSVAEVEDYVQAFKEDPDSLNCKDAALATLRRELGMAKAKSAEAVEFVTSLLDAGLPVVIFAYHRAVIDELMKAFKKWKPVKLDGRTSPAKKQKAVDDFQNGETDVFIGQLQASGVGITLTRSADAVFFEIDWVPSVIEQCCDRLHRITQENAVNLHFLMSQNPLDSKIVGQAIEKQKYIDKVI